MLKNIEKYLDATSQFLGVQSERYGSGYRAIVGLHSDVTWLTDVLTDPGDGGVQLQFFLGANPLFPASWGETATKALENLNHKLGLLYEFIPAQGKSTKWECRLNVEIMAECDTASGEATEMYKVNWFDVVADLREAYSKEGDTYFYEIAENVCDRRRYRNLHALKNVAIPDGFKAQLDQ